MTISGLVTRFTFYATDSRDLNYDPSSKKPSFKLCNIEAVQAALTEGVTFPCMLMQVPQFDKDGLDDNVIEHVECSYIILKPVKTNDFAGRMAAYDDCKSISDQVINHMILDSDTYFEGGMVKTSEGEVGPVGDSLYGWGVNFAFDQGYNGVIDPDRWRTV